MAAALRVAPETAHRARRTPGPEHRDIEPVLEHDVAGGTDPFQKAQILGAAAQEDVLAVVVPMPVVLERPGEAAESLAPVDQGDTDTVLAWLPTGK